MDEITKMIRTVIWTVNAKPREQVLMLRVMDAFGTGEFTATYEELAEAAHMNRSTVIRAVKGLKDLGWMDSERLYRGNGSNLPVVENCKYIVTVPVE